MMNKLMQAVLTENKEMLCSYCAGSGSIPSFGPQMSAGGAVECSNCSGRGIVYGEARRSFKKPMLAGFSFLVGGAVAGLIATSWTGCL